MQMAWRKGLTGVGAASVAFSGAAYYYRPDPSGELLESRRARSPKVRGSFASQFAPTLPPVVAGLGPSRHRTMSHVYASLVGVRGVFLFAAMEPYPLCAAVRSTSSCILQD